MNLFLELAITICIVIGSLFILIGSVGLIRLPDLMTRLHAPSKATTVGVGGCLVASMVNFWAAEGRFSIQEVLITFFLFLTAPVTAHFIAKAHLHTEEKSPDRLPLTGTPHQWSTFSAASNKASSFDKS
jgi:multicomponent K+:H+ antiporter subunit G